LRVVELQKVMDQTIVSMQAELKISEKRIAEMGAPHVSAALLSADMPNSGAVMAGRIRSAQ
jgi:hypothetical protein